MSLTSHVARAFGKRDWVEHAAIDVYNTLAERRRRRVGKGELLVLIPRCLSKQALDGVLAIAGRYDVPVFVATRGQLARRVIRERRPRAVVAVACERDMMTGLRDVAGKLPVLGLTMQLPNGPWRDAALDLDQMERWVQGLVGFRALKQEPENAQAPYRNPLRPSAYTSRVAATKLPLNTLSNESRAPASISRTTHGVPNARAKAASVPRCSATKSVQGYTHAATPTTST